MHDGKEKSVVEWIGMFISILAMLAYSFWGKKAQPAEEETGDTTDSLSLRRASHEEREEEEFIDDEEPEFVDPVHTHANVLAQSKPAVYKSQMDVTKRPVHVQTHAQRQAQRLLSANYRLKNALEGFQQRRPIDKKSSRNAIERRTFDTKVVNESLRVDADADAREAAWIKKEGLLTESGERLRNGMIWSQILRPPVALRKGSDLP